MNLHTIHEPSRQRSDNTDPLIGEACQVNALLHIIETLQAQNEGLNTEQQRTIEELKGRVKDLTDKMDFLESELLAERQKNAEIQEQQEAQERARIQQERARLEAVRKATEEERKRLEAEKPRKRIELYDIEEVKQQYVKARECLREAKTFMNALNLMRLLNKREEYTRTMWEKVPSLYRFYTGCKLLGNNRPVPVRYWYYYKLNPDDPGAEAYLLQQINKYEPLVELLEQQKEALSK